jgi:hypothetical protein
MKFISELKWRIGNSLIKNEWSKISNVSIGEKVVLTPEKDPYNDMRSVSYPDSGKVWALCFNGQITLIHNETGDFIILNPTDKGTYDRT